jgi:hypothetical protein
MLDFLHVTHFCLNIWFYTFLNWYLALYNVAFIIRVNAKGNKLTSPSVWISPCYWRGLLEALFSTVCLTGPGYKHLSTCKCIRNFSVTLNNDIHICGIITWIVCYWIVSRRDLCKIFNHALNNNRRFSFIFVQLVEAPCYKPEGRGFDSWWCHWNFSLT